MGVQYGLNFTASDAKNYLEKNQRQNNGVKTWQQLFGNTSLTATAQSDMLKQNYGDVIAQAYASNLKNQNSIYRAGLTAGSQNQLLNDNRDTLNNAYKQYMQQYAEDVNTLQTNYQEAITAIDNQLNTEAENYAKLLNSTYKYIEDELQYSTYRGVNNEFANMFDESGKLKNWETIAREYNVVDDNGNLSTGATEFFDMVFNASPQTSLYTSKDGKERYAKSFDEWLSDTDNDLRTWWQSADQYNYTKAGTKIGSIKQAVGLESDDQEYHMSEYASTDDERFRYKALGENESVADNYTANEEKWKTVFGSEAELPEEVKTAKTEYDTAVNEYNENKSKYNDLREWYLAVRGTHGVAKDRKKGAGLHYTLEEYLKDKGMIDKYKKYLSYESKYNTSKTKMDTAKTAYDTAWKNAFETQASKGKKKSGY